MVENVKRRQEGGKTHTRAGRSPPGRIRCNGGGLALDELPDQWRHDNPFAAGCGTQTLARDAALMQRMQADKRTETTANYDDG
jgi:hypothetical protein